MTTPDLFALVIKKVGAEWCLFTSDGERKLGCHPTKEAAQEQEAAIKSRQAQASTLCTNKDGEGALEIAAALVEEGIPIAHGTSFIADDAKRKFLVKQFELLGASAFIARFGSSRVVSMYSSFGGSLKACQTKAASFSSDATLFCGALKAAAGQCGADITGKQRSHAPIYLFDSKIDASVAKELPDGSARMDVRLAPEGKDFENAGQTFNLTESDIKRAIENFQKRGGPVPVTIGHYPEEERQRQGAKAWIERMFHAKLDDGNFLMAQMRYLKDAWSRIKNDEFKFLSMEFWTNDKDQHGEDIGLNIDGAAILNYPFFPLRFDQSRGASGFFMTCSSFARSGRRTMGTDDKTKLQEGEFKIEEVEGEFCIFDPSGENKGCWPTREEAEAKLAEIAGAAGGGEAGKKDKGDGGETVTIPKAEYDELRSQQSASKKGDKVLLTRVTNLETENAAYKKRTQAQTIRGCVRVLREDYKKLVKLGDYKDFETDDDQAIKFLKDRPWGVSDIEGLQKLAKDLDACSHLPGVKTGGEVPAGAEVGDGQVDVESEAGRAAAIQKRIQKLRKEFGADLDGHLKARRQTVEEYAREELNIEHPKAGFIKTAK